MTNVLYLTKQVSLLLPQVISQRIVAAALAVALKLPKNPLSYPPPQFLSQVPGATGTGCSMTVQFSTFQNVDVSNTGDAKLMFSATTDPGTGKNSSECPTDLIPGVQSNCSGFELLCTTPEIPHNQSNPAKFVFFTASTDHAQG